VQQGIEQVLATMAEIELVAMCETTAQLERTIEAGGVDVVMTDIRMPPGQSDEGIEFAAQLRETNPEIGVIILSQFLEPEYAVRLFEQGAAGRAYLLKERIATPGEMEERALCFVYQPEKPRRCSKIGGEALALLLRFHMQWLRAPVRNPLSQFLGALTDWVVVPTRRIIPGFGGLDIGPMRRPVAVTMSRVTSWPRAASMAATAA
jgi:CheY-like chemotaxis protein